MVALVERAALVPVAAVPTVLVVEDEFVICMAAADHLREFGHRVLEARTGEAAQDIMRSGEAVDVLFSDINLGTGIDGFALAQWTREHDPRIRIMLTSGVVRPGRLAAGLSDAPFLLKPYAYEEVVRCVARLTESRRQAI